MENDETENAFSTTSETPAEIGLPDSGECKPELGMGEAIDVLDHIIHWVAGVYLATFSGIWHFIRAILFGVWKFLVCVWRMVSFIFRQGWKFLVFVFWICRKLLLFAFSAAASVVRFGFELVVTEGFWSVAKRVGALLLLAVPILALFFAVSSGLYACVHDEWGHNTAHLFAWTWGLGWLAASFFCFRRYAIRLRKFRNNKKSVRSGESLPTGTPPTPEDGTDDR